MVIEPISELKNYNTLLEEVRDGYPIYLTKNGKGLYAIMTINDASDYEKYQINKEFEKDLKANVADQDFFVKDIESLNRKLEKALDEAMKEEERGEEGEDFSVFMERMKKEIINGTI